MNSKAYASNSWCAKWFGTQAESTAFSELTRWMPCPGGWSCKGLVRTTIQPQKFRIGSGAYSLPTEEKNIIVNKSRIFFLLMICAIFLSLEEVSHLLGMLPKTFWHTSDDRINFNQTLSILQWNFILVLRWTGRNLQGLEKEVEETLLLVKRMMKEDRKRLPIRWLFLIYWQVFQFI